MRCGKIGVVEVGNLLQFPSIAPVLVHGGLNSRKSTANLKKSGASQLDDRLVWKSASDGKFSVVALSNFMRSFDLEGEVDCSMVWQLEVPSKVQCFIWFVMLGRLSTLSFLKDRGLPSAITDLSCRWSGESEDAIGHILLHCRIIEEPPPCGVLKFNVDGSTRGKPGPASCGGVLRDDHGQILALFSGPLGVLESNDAEIRAICHALLLLRVFIESDSLVAVSWVLEYERRPWTLWSWFRQIDFICTELVRVCFQHLYREANSLADALAKGGVERLSWFPMLES
ncbi:hypothetical protein GQ457_17G024020 [Hibiscus cannabinus]